MLWEELEEKRGVLEGGILLINLLIMGKDGEAVQQTNP